MSLFHLEADASVKIYKFYSNNRSKEKAKPACFVV